LAGRVNAGQFPTGPDGLVTPNFREANARYFAEQHGVNLGSGSHITPDGKVHAVNDQAWYADPRWIGPIAVGAATAGFGAAGGGSAAAPGVSGVAHGGADVGYNALGSVVGDTSALGPVAAAGGTTAASVPSTLSAVTGGAAPAAETAAASRPLWESIARLAVPGAFTALTQRRNGSPSTGVDPNVSGQLSDLLRLASEKAQRTVPVHEAAMRLAMNMAPTSTSSPRMDAAIQSAQTPRPQQTLDPQVLDAIRRLTGGMG
jgi:hypothetical protein